MGERGKVLLSLSQQQQQQPLVSRWERGEGSAKRLRRVEGEGPHTSHAVKVGRNTKRVKGGREILLDSSTQR